MNKDTLDELLESIGPKLREYRRDFHKHAETGWGEYRTASVIARRLDELGYKLKFGRDVVDEKSRMGLPSDEVMQLQYERALAEGAAEEYLEKFRGGFTGLVAELSNGEGPTFGFRFDIDAVEMEEKESGDHFPCRQGFASLHKEGMHSCGHDGHASIGLGLAEVLAGRKDRLKGRVKLIFQPAEEGARGAKAMVEAGVVDDVDFLIGLHIGAKAKITGEFFCGVDGFLATSKFDAYFQGAPAHAGLDPEEGRNALLSAATAALSLHAISRHGGGATRINVGKLTAGTGRNVIPSDAHLLIETRGENSNLNGYMKAHAERIIKGSAEIYGTDYRIVRMGDAEDADSDDELMRRIYAVAKKHAVFPELREEKIHFGGSEDFTHMMKRVTARGGKATFLLLGSRLKGNHHTAAFDFDESILVNGVKILSLIALELV
jgi:aminobenzoyl-glutamate utilization protein A